MSDYKALVFDFDATIADTALAGVEIYNDLALQSGYKQVTVHNMDELRRKSSREAIVSLGIPILKAPFISARVKRILSKDIDKLRPIAGIPEVLEALKTKGILLGIITSNSQENVDKFLTANNLQIFDFIYIASTFGKSKVINRALKENGLNKEDIAYIGDETRDVSAAKKSGVFAVGVTWGLALKDSLNEAGADKILEKPSEILELAKI